MKEIITPFSSLKNKTGKHKDWYTPKFVQIFCHEINPKNKYFKNIDFINSYKKSYKNLELKDRMKLISSLLCDYLDCDYKKQLKILSALLGDPWPYEDGMFTYGFFLYPFSQFIEMNCGKDFEQSLMTIEKLTMQFTGEWAIRPLANMDGTKVLKQMKLWSKHENFHVRRLSSEGLRLRLPWGMKIDWANKNPEKTLPIYNKLRNDKSLYVRRSVANAMGDIIKVNEDLAYATFQKWLSMKKTKENLWVIKHAIRTPLKKNNKVFISLNKEVKKLTHELS